MNDSDVLKSIELAEKFRNEILGSIVYSKKLDNKLVNAGISISRKPSGVATVYVAFNINGEDCSFSFDVDDGYIDVDKINLGLSRAIANIFNKAVIK